MQLDFVVISQTFYSHINKKFIIYFKKKKYNDERAREWKVEKNEHSRHDDFTVKRIFVRFSTLLCSTKYLAT